MSNRPNQNQRSNQQPAPAPAPIPEQKSENTEGVDIDQSTIEPRKLEEGEMLESGALPEGLTESKTDAPSDNQLPKVELTKPEPEVINQATVAEMISPITMPSMPEPEKIEADLFGIEPSRTCKSMIAVLDTYLDKMDTNKYCPLSTITQQQAALCHLYKSWLKTEDINDFLMFSEYILTKVSELRDLTFSPLMVNRGFDEVSLPLSDRTAMALVNALLHNVTNPDKKFGYQLCGKYEQSLSKAYGDDAALRLSLYLKRYCGLN